MPPESPPGAVPTAMPPGRSAPWPRWVVYSLVVLAALVGGAVAGATVTLLVVEDRPEDLHVVTVFLDGGATAEQRTAVESALSRMYPPDRIRRQSREQTLETLREDYLKDFGAEVKAELGESFRVELPGSSIDCPALAPVGKMPGVQLVAVGQPADDDRPYALLLECP
ncbi:permease-like cell division protein FtsX [Phytohabitans sp. LJ34]|uniref:permease-like cell division protein FtsX n=1 Tax=Phytohabitans sp. LJ34 TaxID=3452217 RepID=UPI003F8CC186